jgi:hypothetical protein
VYWVGSHPQPSAPATRARSRHHPSRNPGPAVAARSAHSHTSIVVSGAAIEPKADWTECVRLDSTNQACRDCFGIYWVTIGRQFPRFICVFPSHRCERQGRFVVQVLGADPTSALYSATSRGFLANSRAAHLQMFVMSWKFPGAPSAAGCSLLILSMYSTSKQDRPGTGAALTMLTTTRTCSFEIQRL